MFKCSLSNLLKHGRSTFLPCLRLITLNTVGLGLNGVYFKPNLHTAFPNFTGSALGLVVVRNAGMTDDHFASGLLFHRKDGVATFQEW